MDNQLFYVVHPAQLVFPYLGMSLQQRRNRLGQLIMSQGAQWAAVRMRAPVFMDAVEQIDEYLIAGQRFVDSAFDNSPQQMLLTAGSTETYDPLLGYYEPAHVREFERALNVIPGDVVNRWENGPHGEIMSQVLHAFRSTFAQAARRRYAVAVEHR